MTRGMDRSVAQLLHRFQKVCAILEKENALLAAGKLQNVADLFPAKQKAMELLEAMMSGEESAPMSSERKQVLMTAETEEAARRFGALARANRTLLRNAIDAQNILIRLIVVDAAQDAVAGYAASGRYATNVLSHEALTLRSDV